MSFIDDNAKGTPDDTMHLGRFLHELDRALRRLESSPDWMAARWSTTPGYRTNRVTGAYHAHGPSNRRDCVLAETMHCLGYAPNESDSLCGELAHLYRFEWQRIDLVAATSPGKWGDCVWKGQYRLDLALEVENNPAEFTLHMRGILDTKAVHRVCIFYTNQDDPLQTEVGTGSGMVPAGEWTWPPPESQGWAPPVTARLVAVFVGLSAPRIVGAYAWSTDAPGTRPIPLSWSPDR